LHFHPQFFEGQPLSLIFQSFPGQGLLSTFGNVARRMDLSPSLFLLLVLREPDLFPLFSNLRNGGLPEGVSSSSESLFFVLCGNCSARFPQTLFSCPIELVFPFPLPPSSECLSKLKSIVTSKTRFSYSFFPTPVPVAPLRLILSCYHNWLCVASNS